MSKNEKNIYSSKIEMLEKENAMLRRKVQRFEGEGEENHE